MSKRKIWSQHQDTVLKVLRQERGVKKWSQIAKKMEEQFGITQRTGKQCRQRYHNHLDSSIIISQWSPIEEQMLHKMHLQFGNKWSQISQKIPGRSDNCIKNHFYSKLRKSIRRLNRIIQQDSQAKWRLIKLPLLNKIVQTTQERFKNNSKYEDQIIQKCLQIVNRLFCLDHLQGQHQINQQLHITRLIDDTMWIENKLKKLSKYSCRQSKELMETTVENKQILRNTEITSSTQPSQELYYQIFKRVCSQILHNNY